PSGFCTILCRGLPLIRHTPMESNHHAIDLIAKSTYVGGQVLAWIHRTSWESRARGGAAIPIITEEPDPPGSGWQDARSVGLFFVEASADRAHASGRQSLQGLNYTLTATIEQVIVRQRHYVDSSSRQRAGRFGMHTVGVGPLLFLRLTR